VGSGAKTRPLLILVLFEPRRTLVEATIILASKQVILELVCCHFRDMAAM